MKKKTPSKVGYFSKIAEIFNTSQNSPVARQLKTLVAFSMFPILDTNIWGDYGGSRTDIYKYFYKIQETYHINIVHIQGTYYMS